MRAGQGQLRFVAVVVDDDVAVCRLHVASHQGGVQQTGRWVSGYSSACSAAQPQLQSCVRPVRHRGPLPCVSAGATHCTAAIEVSVLSSCRVMCPSPAGPDSESWLWQEAQSQARPKGPVSGCEPV